MSDFVDDLERELLAAAHRRRTRRSLPRRPLLFAATALAAAAVALGLRPAPDDRPVGGTPGAFAVPALAAPEICDPAVRLPKRGTEQTRATLAVLKQFHRTGDRLPSAVVAAASTWLPVGDWNGGTRLPLGVTDRVLVLATNDVRARPLACGESQRRGPGACLVIPARTREALRVRCFTLAEIRAGQAFAVLGERLLGLLPNTSSTIELTARSRTVRIPVVENVVDHRLPGVRAGAEIAARLIPHATTVTIVGGRRLAEQLAARLRAQLDDVEVKVGTMPRPSGSRIFVQALRPGSGPLSRRVARILDADAVGDNPPLPTRIQTDTPDVVVVLQRTR